METEQAVASVTQGCVCHTAAPGKKWRLEEPRPADSAHRGALLSEKAEGKEPEHHFLHKRKGSISQRDALRPLLDTLFHTGL